MKNIFQKIQIQKVVKFVKYHNAFSIGLVLVFLITASAFADEEIRNTLLGEEIVIEKQGIDNTVILSADLDNFDFQLQITGVSEDTQNYYIDYSYNSLAIKDDIWQEVTREETLTVSKKALAGRDLGLYVTEELGETADCELAYLKEVQTAEKQKGKTEIVETTDYTGLIGLVLDIKNKILPGYEPVIEPIEIVVESGTASLIQPENDNLSDAAQEDGLPDGFVDVNGDGRDDNTGSFLPFNQQPQPEPNPEPELAEEPELDLPADDITQTDSPSDEPVFEEPQPATQSPEDDKAIPPTDGEPEPDLPADDILETDTPSQ